MATTITTWTSLIEYFLSVFTQPTGIIFMQLMTGWILCTTRRTTTGIIPFADPQRKRPHDAFHRIYPDARWVTSELWRLLTVLLVAVFCPNGVIILYLDDTVFHRSGRKVQGASWHRDAVRSTGTKIVYAWGLKLVVLTIGVKAPWGGEPLGLPINMRLFRKGQSNLIDLAEEMLHEVMYWLPQRQFIACGDGFYATLVGRATRQMEIISRIRCDARIFALPSPKPKHQRGPHPRKGRRLDNPQKMAPRITSWKTIKTNERGKERRRQVYTREVIWYDVSHQPVLLTISRDPEGIEEDDFLSVRRWNVLRQRSLLSSLAAGALKIPLKIPNNISEPRNPRPGKAQVPSVPPCWVFGCIRWYGSGSCCRKKIIASCPRFPGILTNRIRVSKMHWHACDVFSGRNELKYCSVKRPYMIKFLSSYWKPWLPPLSYFEKCESSQ